MIPIFINTSDITSEFPAMEKDTEVLIDYVVKDVTERFAEEWQNEALRTLKTSKVDYVKNIIMIDSGWLKGAVVLQGWLPNSIESGLDAFDMKNKIINGKNSKVGENGKRWNTIPFSVGSPGVVSDSELYSSILPQSTYNVIQTKPQNVPSKGGGVRTEGLKVSEIPAAYREPEKMSAKTVGNKTYEGYQRKFSTQAGVTKIKDAKTGQNRYMSFRRVSENSDENSWIHSGIEAKNLADKALNNMQMEHIVGKSIDTFLSQNGYV